MNNLLNNGMEILTAEEMQTVRGGYQLIWDFGDRPAPKPEPPANNQ